MHFPFGEPWDKHAPEVVRLSEGERLSQREIAGRLGISKATVNEILKRREQRVPGSGLPGPWRKILRARYSYSVFAYRRTDPDGGLLVGLNFAAQERRLPDAFGGVPLLSGDPRRAENATNPGLRLAPREAPVLAAP